MEPAFVLQTSLAVGLVAAAIYLLSAGIALIYQYERGGGGVTLDKYSGTRDPDLTFILLINQSLRRVDRAQRPRISIAIFLTTIE